MQTQTQQSVILRARQLTKTYRMGREDLKVLSGVDLNVKAGEWLCILGASGSGKSTLLHLLGGLDTPDLDSGDVKFQDVSLHTLTQSKRDHFRNKHVGFVFQFYHLLPELNVVENTMITTLVGHSMFGLAAHLDELRPRVITLLSELGLGDRLNHTPNELSGGERQRVAIARAMVNEPELLLADEPTGNLDKNTGLRILDLFQKMHDNGQTIVMVTHDQTVADRADRVLHLESGKLVK